MSGQPGDIPKFVNDMIGPLADEEVRPVRPKSEITQPSDHAQAASEVRPKSDIPRTSDASRPSYQAHHQQCDKLEGKEPSKLRNDDLLKSGELGAIPFLSQAPPKSAEKPGSSSKDASRPSYQAHEQCDKLEGKELSKSRNDGPLKSGELGMIPYLSQTPPKSAEKQGASTSSKDEKPAPIIINKETQRLVEELQRQYSQPVFINDGVQQLMDDMKERPGTSASGASYRQKSPQCKRICPAVAENFKIYKF